jgi:hypothetical protein
MSQSWNIQWDTAIDIVVRTISLTRLLVVMDDDNEDDNDHAINA